MQHRVFKGRVNNKIDSTPVSATDRHGLLSVATTDGQRRLHTPKGVLICCRRLSGKGRNLAPRRSDAGSHLPPKKPAPEGAESSVVPALPGVVSENGENRTLSRLQGHSTEAAQPVAGALKTSGVRSFMRLNPKSIARPIQALVDRPELQNGATARRKKPHPDRLPRASAAMTPELPTKTAFVSETHPSTPNATTP